METLNDLTLKQIVIQQPGTASIFEKYGLDFCCKGGKTLEHACEEKKINFQDVQQEIQKVQTAQENGSAINDFNNMELDVLADYIVQKHHTYVKENLQMISAHTQKVARVHGERHTELIEIANYFDKVKSELEMHMMKEEQILFPYIKLLAQAKRNNASPTPPPFGTLRNPITMMEAEHEFVGDALEKIKTLTNNYESPNDACTTFRLSFIELNEFTKDLHQHIHLENNILFPKAIELENYSFQTV